jgi:hypothetical protein
MIASSGEGNIIKIMNFVDPPDSVVKRNEKNKKIAAHMNK